MQKINAIFVKYGYPIFPLGVVPFIYFWGYFILDISFYFSSSSLPDWYRKFWLIWAVWFVIFVITKKYCAYMKLKRIRQEIKTFNTSFNSTGMIRSRDFWLSLHLIEFQEYQWILTYM